MKIAFWDNQLCVRGTTVALFDYAYYNQTILGNESIIMYDTTKDHTVEAVVDKFKKHFKVIGVTDFSQVDPILVAEKCDVIYVIEGGYRTDLVSKVCKTLTHCVFTCGVPHGTVYSAIGAWVPENNGKYPVVPHMINLPDIADDWRKELGIPQSATVFGRHGGAEQFDIGYVQRTVYDIARTHPHIYFLLMNTHRFCPPLPNIIHVAPVVSLVEKAKFINTCDAMLHARSEGEIFSLSMGEFASRNKPVFCTRMGSDGHIHLMGDRAFWYTESTLLDMLVSFDKSVECRKDWNTYKEYTPEKVMAVFKEVYLS